MSAPKQKSTAVAPAAATSVAGFDPELLAQFQEHAGEGLNDARAEDKAIPFLSLLQQLSPQLAEGDAKYIDGAKAGDMLNTVTGEVYKGKEGVEVVPVLFRPVYNLWVPRDQGGGFLGSFEDPEMKRPVGGQTFQRAAEHQGPTTLVLTHNHFVLVKSADGTWTPALLSMKSTQLKVSRRWNSEIDLKKIPGTGAPAPRYAKAYRLTSVGEENEKGRYHNFVVTDAGFVDAATFHAAVAFRQQLQAGAVKVDYAKDTDEDAAPAPETGGPGF